MTYFELFEMPVQLKVDRSLLPQKYFALSRKYHPDLFVHNPEVEKRQALEISAQLNKALHTLKDEDETIRYVLQLKGLLQEGEKFELPPDFLMEMLDLNEALDGASDPLIKKNIRSAIENIQYSIYEPVKKIIESYQEGITSEKELLQVKDYYFKKKYLKRILEKLPA